MWNELGEEYCENFACQATNCDECRPDDNTICLPDRCQNGYLFDFVTLECYEIPANCPTGCECNKYNDCIDCKPS